MGCSPKDHALIPGLCTWVRACEDPAVQHDKCVLVFLLLAHTYCGKRRCNYKEILDSYKAVIFIKLQHLNLTGPFNTTNDRDACPAGKARRILVSIYGMTQQIRCQWSGRQQPSALEKPVESMEKLISNNCSPGYLGKKTSCSTVKRIRGKKRRRDRLIKVIQALITCWQKLQSVLMVKK